MDKEKTERAKQFWIGIGEILEKRLVQAIKDSPGADEEKRFYLEYANRLKELPADKSSLLLNYVYLVRPRLPWDSIRAVLSKYGIDDKETEGLIFALKPTPIEQTLVSDENPLDTINATLERFIKDWNERIKRETPLVKRLENLAEHDMSYAGTTLYPAIRAIKNDIEKFRALIKVYTTTEKRYLESQLLDKDIKKSPQKHSYWTFVVSNALKILNPLCHDDACERRCRKTHQRALLVTAELLKILYPLIWTEDIEIIVNRIKQKDYRNIQ